MRKHYKSTRSLLTETIKNISDGNLIHDCIIAEAPLFVDENFCIKFSITAIGGMCRDKSWFSAIDLSDSESDFFMLSGLTFIGANILKNELSFGYNKHVCCSYSEMHLHPDGYEMRILAFNEEAGTLTSELAELIITFKDIVIEVEEVR